MIYALIVLTSVAAMPAKHADNGFLSALPHAVSFVLERLRSEDSVSAGGTIFFSASRASRTASRGLGQPIDSAAVAGALGRPYEETRPDVGITCSPKPGERGETTNCQMRDAGIGIVLRSVARADSILTLVVVGLVTRELKLDSSEVLTITYELEYRERPDGAVLLARWWEVVRGPVTMRAVPALSR